MSTLPPLTLNSPPQSQEFQEKISRGTAQRRLAEIDMNKVDPRIVKSAQGLESMFLQQLTKAMRKNVQTSEMSLENSATRIYRDMLDGELAQQAAQQDGIGLAKQYIEYLHASGYPIYKEEPSSSAHLSEAQTLRGQMKVGTGGTDEDS